jgi:hypothetical protein
MTTLKELFGEDLTKWSTEITERPDGFCVMKGAKYYLVVLMYDGKALSTHYTLGQSFNRTPEKLEVLSSMITESVLQGCPFEEWCSEMGMDEDSIRAKKLYDHCVSEGNRLAWFLGEDMLNKALNCTDLHD